MCSIAVGLSFLSLSYGAYYTIKDIAMWDNFIIPASRFPGSTGIRRHYGLFYGHYTGIPTVFPTCEDRGGRVA